MFVMEASSDYLTLLYNPSSTRSHYTLHPVCPSVRLSACIDTLYLLLTQEQKDLKAQN